ncbi:MAG: CBS domain-containing protein [Vampirovibrio sp.]|nr:CBS domain-containing protein [Vampirovibrio sp.]
MTTASPETSAIPWYVKDVMTTKLITARDSMNIRDFHALLLEHRITGTPVVDGKHNLLGVITLSDILVKDRVLYELDEYMVQDDLVKWLRKGTVKDHMTKKLIAVPPTMTLEAAAQLMENRHIHRVFVAEAGNKELLGVLSAFDLAKVITKWAKIVQKDATSSSVTPIEPTGV